MWCTWRVLRLPSLLGASPRGILGLVLFQSRMQGTRPALQHEVGGRPPRRIETNGGQIPGSPCRSSARYARTSRRVFLVIQREPGRYVPEGSGEGRRFGNTPTETYNTSVCEICEEQKVLMSYIPSALFVRTSITSCLSLAFHLCIIGSALTTNLI